MAQTLSASTLIATPAGLNSSWWTQSRANSTACFYSVRCAGSVSCSNASHEADVSKPFSRREGLGYCSLAATYFIIGGLEKVDAAGLPEEEKARLCDVDCEKELENVPTVTTPSGLQYKDIVVGKGSSPPIGFQVYAHYVAMIPNGKIFDSSLEKNQAYTFRVGSGQVIKGLDEGILSMKVGGKRRLYIPGELAFQKGLGAAAGRPRVPPSSPVIFDVNLLLIPGLEDFEEE